MWPFAEAARRGCSTPSRKPSRTQGELYYTIVYYAMLYYTMLCYTTLYYTILYWSRLPTVGFHNFNLRIFNFKSEQINCACFFDTMSDFNVPGSRPKQTQ